jgi:hypothetical protein
MEHGMTRHSLQRNSLRGYILIGIFGILAGCSNIAESQGAQTMNSQMTLWQLIDSVSQQTPFSAVKIEKLFSTQLSEYDNPSNDVFRFYKGGRTTLANGVVISNVDLRIKRQGPHPGFLVLELQGTCVGVEEVRKHYSGLEITDTPRGKSLDDVTSHTTIQAWGELSFSFKERKPECLSSIVFDPKKPQ